MSDILSSCRELDLVRFRCVYDARAVSLLARMLSAVTHVSYPDLYLPFDAYPACRKPTAREWAALDRAFQGATWSALKRLRMMRRTLAVEDPTKFVWGTTYPEDESDQGDAEKWRNEIRESLHLTVKQGKVSCRGIHLVSS